MDLKRDLFRVAYDPEHVTPARLLETVRAQGFHGEVAQDASAKPEIARPVRRDMSRLPEEHRKAVQDAKRIGKPLLLAFHGPG